MARTPQRTLGQDFTVISGDAITGDDATGGAGGALILEGGSAGAATNTDGGDVTLRPGLGDGSGTVGELIATNRGGTEDDPILAFTSAAGNAHTFRWRTGTVEPNSDSVPASDGGDLYVRSDGTMWIASGSGTGNWSEFSAGGAGGALAGIPGVLYGTQTAETGTDNVFYLDAGDRNSYPGNSSTWTDIIGSRAGTLTNIAVTDGHFIFNGATATSSVSYASDATIEDIWDGGATLIAWVRADTFGQSSAGRVAGTTDAGNTLGWYAGITGASGSTWKLYFRQNFTSTDGEWRTTSTLNLDEWVMVALTYDSSSAANEPSLYINSILDTTDEVANPVGDFSPESAAALVVGAAPAATGTWGGAIEVVVLFDTELSQAAIRQIYRVTGEDRLRPSLIGPDATDASQPAQPIEIVGGKGGATDGDGANIDVTGGSATTGFGGDVSLTGGASTSVGSGEGGGDVRITGGSGAVSSTTQGGDVTITGGELTGGLTPATAGDITIESGAYTGGSTGRPGAITIKTGVGTANSGDAPDLTLEVTSYSSSGDAGDLILQGGSRTGGSGEAGQIQILGGDATAPTGSVGGPIIITAGTVTGSGDTGGAITVTTGTSSNGRSGTMTLQVPTALSSARGTGDLNLTIGNTQDNWGTTSNKGGSISLVGGNHTGTAGSSPASSINLTAGNSASASSGSNAGSITLTAGNQTGNITTTYPGDINLIAGSKTGWSARGGAIDIDAGDGNGSGPGGAIEVNAGVAGATGTGGAVTVWAGAGGATSGTGGVLDFNAGGSGVGATGTGGAVTIDAGACNATNGAGGGVTVTAGGGSGTGAGGAVTLRGNDGGATSGAGGAASLSGGEGGGSGVGGALSLQAGPGGATAAGGDVAINAGGGGATSGASGTITASGGDGGSATVAGGAVTLQGGDGNTTGAGGLATVQGGTAGASGAGGAVAITGRAGATNGDGGDITLTAGASAGAGADGDVLATTDDDGAFQHRTQTTGFTGTQGDHKTYGTQDAVGTETTTQTVVTLGTLDTDGQNMKIEVRVTAVDNLVDTNFIGFQYSQDFYRASGSIGTVPAHIDSQNAVGVADFANNVSFDVTAVGDDILLRVTNNSSSNSYTLNIAVLWLRQEGGFAS